MKGLFKSNSRTETVLASGDTCPQAFISSDGKRREWPGRRETDRGCEWLLILLTVFPRQLNVDGVDGGVKDKEARLRDRQGYIHNFLQLLVANVDVIPSCDTSRYDAFYGFGVIGDTPNFFLRKLRFWCALLIVASILLYQDKLSWYLCLFMCVLHPFSWSRSPVLLVC